MKLPYVNFNTYRAYGRLKKCYFGTAWNNAHSLSNKRCIHVSIKNYGGTIWEPDRRGGPEFDREDPNPKSDKEHLERGSKMLIPETKKMITELKDYFSQDPPKYLYPQGKSIVLHYEWLAC